MPARRLGGRFIFEIRIFWQPDGGIKIKKGIVFVYSRYQFQELDLFLYGDKVVTIFFRVFVYLPIWLFRILQSMLHSQTVMWKLLIF